MSLQDKKSAPSRKGSQASARSSGSELSTTRGEDPELTKLRLMRDIARLKAEQAAHKNAARSEKAVRSRKDRQQSYSSSSSSGSESCASSCCSDAPDTKLTKPAWPNPSDPFGRPSESSFGRAINLHGWKGEGMKSRIVDIVPGGPFTGGVVCENGTVGFNDFGFSDCKNIIKNYIPESTNHIRESSRRAAEARNADKRRTFLETYTHIQFQTTFRHPELISEPTKKHYHEHHRRGHRHGSGRDKTVHTLPYDPFNPFSGPRPGGF